MHHIAIMKKEWNMIEKILQCEKIIESRWYLQKRDPYNKISKGDTIFFKEVYVKAKAEVKYVKQFSDLTPEKIKHILEKYGKDICIPDNFYDLVKDKKYCILIFLKNPEKVKPFDINKKGFGSMASWLCVDDVEKIKLID